MDEERQAPQGGYIWVQRAPNISTRVFAEHADSRTYQPAQPIGTADIPKTTGMCPCAERPGAARESFALPYSRALQRLVSRQCDMPMIMPANNSITVTFDPSSTKRCGADGIAPPISRFVAIGYTSGAYYAPLNFFGFTWNGQHYYGFCLNHEKNMPSGAYPNISMEQAMPSFSRQVQLAVSFAIAQAPAFVTDDAGAREMFEMLGSPCADEANGYDAYGVVQAAIWCLLGQGDPGFVYFENCDEGTASAAKLACMREAMNALFTMAFQFANGELDCGGAGGGGSLGMGSAQANFNSCRASCGCGGNCCDTPCTTCEGEEGTGCCPARACCGCQVGKLFVCYTGQAVTDQSDTYLVFVGCTNDMREHCGRILLGPFVLASSNSGMPDLEIVPCEGCPPITLTITDYCGCALGRNPEIGEEFYITFLPPCLRYCFDLKASMDTYASAVYYFHRTSANNLQPVGVPMIERRHQETSIHICIDLTPPPLPPPPPPPPNVDILINNENDNNNNNNNDANTNLNDSNSSSMLHNALENALSSMLSGGVSNATGGGLMPLMAMNGMLPGMLPGMGMPPGAGTPGFPCGIPGFPGGQNGFGFPCKPQGAPCSPCAKPPGGPPPIQPPAFPPPCPCPPPCLSSCSCPPPWVCPPTPPPLCHPPQCPPMIPCPCSPDPCNTINLIVQPPQPPEQMPAYQVLPLPVPCMAAPPLMCPQPMPAPMPMMQPFAPMPDLPYASQEFAAAQYDGPAQAYWYPPPYEQPTRQPYITPTPPPYAPQPMNQGPPPVMEPRLLLPEVSGAPHPDLSAIEFNDDFYRDWYQM